MIALLLLFLLLLPLPSWAATYYVRTDGHNTSCNGTANASAASAPNCAWLTVQKAASTAVAGDTVNIQAGTYFEKVTFANSGTAGNPIVFQGVSNTTTIIDGSQATSGWVVSSTYGGGLTYETTLGYDPGMLFSNNQTIWRIHDANMSSGVGGTWLGYSPTATRNGVGINVVVWDGIEAIAGYQSGKTYLRFRNGTNPSTMNVRATTQAPTLFVDGKNYITIKNMRVRGGLQQVYLKNGSDHIVLDGNYLEGGQIRVLCNIGGGCSNATITNNTLTLNAIGMQAFTPGDWTDASYNRAVNENMYHVAKFVYGNTDDADSSIWLYQASNPTITNNVIERSMQGISLWNTIPNIDIGNNTFQYFSDNAIYSKPDGGTMSGQIHDNLFIDADHLLRFDTNENATYNTLYVYKNKFWQPCYSGYGGPKVPKAMFVTSPGDGGDGVSLRIKFYQNTTTGCGWSMDIGSFSAGSAPFPNMQVVNNFWSTSHGLSSTGMPNFQEYANNGTYSIWANGTLSNFTPPAGHASINAGLNIVGRSWPGADATYFIDGQPDIGAVQVGTVTPVPGCDRYASNNGTGTGLAVDSPYKISNFLAAATSGQTLCLHDGVYSGSGNLLQAATTVPITVRPINVGAVILDGLNSARPIDISGNNVTVKDINARCGSDSTVRVSGNTNTVQRVVAWCLADGANWDVGGGGNLIEDSAVFGRVREMLTVGHLGGVGPNIVRRFWVRHEDCNSGGTGCGPNQAAEMGYGQDNVIFENVIATVYRFGAFQVTGEPPLSVFSTQGSKLLGSIAYVPANAVFDATSLLGIWSLGGTGASLTHPTRNTQVQDVVAVMSTSHPRFNSVKGFFIEGDNGAVGNTATNVVGVGGVASTTTGTGWTFTSMKSGSSIANALGNSNSIFAEVPGICKQYVNGTITTAALWPWPMDDRINSALQTAGRPPLNGGSLTEEIKQVLGPIPSSCLTNAIAPVPTAIQFIQMPTNVVQGRQFAPLVAARIIDENSVPIQTPNVIITVALGANPASGTLSGTLQRTTDSRGEATFSDLSINNVGTGYTLVLSGNPLTGVTSTPFNVLATGPPPPTGLRLKLTFNGDKLDTGGGGYNGTGGSTTFVTGPRPGMQALQFVKASSHKVTNATFPWTAADGVTFMGWVYSTPPPPGTANGLFNIGPGDRFVAGQQESFSAEAPNDVGSLEWFYGATQESCALPFANYMNQWVHLALTGSGPTGNIKKMYINGILQHTCTVPPPSTGGPLSGDLTDDSVAYRIGSAQPYGTEHFFGGNIAGVELHNRILSDQEIFDSYNSVALEPPILDSFDMATTQIPFQTYGKGREPCELPTGTDVTLTAAGAWEATLEAATPGIRYFLRAGTYTTATLDLASGTNPDQIVVKPYNCEAVTINAVIKPGNYNTLAGMTLAHSGDGSESGLGATVAFPSLRSGVVIKNNDISSVNDWTIYMGSKVVDTTIQGNTITSTGSVANNTAYLQTEFVNVKFLENRFENQNGYNIVETWGWKGDVTFARNYYYGSLHNPHDIKFAQAGTYNNLITLEDNYFRGEGVGAPGNCVLVQSASDALQLGPGAYAYTAFIRRNFFHHCKQALYHYWSQDSPTEALNTMNNTLWFRHNVVLSTDANVNTNGIWIEMDKANVAYNTFILGRMIWAANSATPDNLTVRNNIFYGSYQFNFSEIDTCLNNDYYNNAGDSVTACNAEITSDPLLVNPLSDWRLQAASPARGTAQAQGDMGAIPFTPELPTQVWAVNKAHMLHFFRRR